MAWTGKGDEMNEEQALYECSFDSGEHWEPISISGVKRILSAYYIYIDEVLEQINSGDVIRYGSIRFKRSGMQAD